MHSMTTKTPGIISKGVKQTCIASEANTTTNKQEKHAQSPRVSFDTQQQFLYTSACRRGIFLLQFFDFF
jgi:hypothetical protein